MLCPGKGDRRIQTKGGALNAGIRAPWQGHGRNTERFRKRGRRNFGARERNGVFTPGQGRNGHHIDIGSFIFPIVIDVLRGSGKRHDACDAGGRRTYIRGWRGTSQRSRNSGGAQAAGQRN
jgi:hypothetical protein